MAKNTAEPRNPADESALARQSPRIRVGIVDDHPVFRLGLRSLLGSQDDLEVVFLAESGQAALALVQQHQTDICLVDLRMQELSGIETLRRLQDQNPDIRSIVISSFGYDEEIYAAVQAGATGFVHKEADPQEILRAIRTVAAGDEAFPPQMAERLAAKQMTAGLSTREREILQLVAIGLTNKEVASSLHISQFTVRNHLNHITRKLDATDRTEAIFLALRTGLISLP